MTEVLIDGVVRTIRDSTLTKYNKIKALAARGYTFRKIKDELKCGNNTIQDALKYVPNSVPKTKGTKGTSQLRTPPPPPIRDSVPILTGTKKEHDEKAMWDAYRPPKKTYTKPVPKIKFAGKDEFILWCKAQDPLHFTGNRRAVLERIQKHQRYGLSEGTVDLYIEFCNPKSTLALQSDVIGELKQVLQKRNGGT